VRYQRTC